jgi:phage terminase large subunit-like protein
LSPAKYSKASTRRETPKRTPKHSKKNSGAPAAPIDPHVVKALDYCRQVLSGKIPACKWVRKACQRQIDDLKRAATDPRWRFRFDEGKAGRACRFLEQLPHVKGPKAGQLLQLELWQCFVATTLFGWVRRDTGHRRFRRGYIEVPRGNGKSFFSSGIALYMLGPDGEQGAEVYSAATTTSQALIVHGDAVKMLRKRPVLQEKLGFRLFAHAIAHPASNSTFQALSREAKNHDGKNVHGALVDELHAHPTRELWDVIVTGAAKRPQSLVWAITTAGTDTSGICYEVRDGVVKMLEGADNDALFGLIFTIDDEDDWRLESSWIKANPNWDSSIDHDAFRVDAAEALQTASKENNFKTKHLNVWCNAALAWMQMGAWDACADPSLKVEAFARQPCVDGLDLASKIDLAARSQLFWKDLPAQNDPKKTERHFYLFVNCYLPQAAVDESRNAQYAGWAKEGWIRTTPGDVLDFEAISDDVLSDQATFDLREVAFDPWQATQLANELQAKAVKMVEVRPTVQSFSEPMKQMEALVLQKRLHHDGNPAMRWMISNVVCQRDAKDNIYPRKERPENKIDGPVASLMSLNRGLLAPEEEGGSYLDSGPAVVLG